QHANEVMRLTLEQNPQTLGIWTAWEPDAWDGRDAEFAGKDGHDRFGRFAPYWNRVNGHTRVEPCPAYWEEDYYRIPLRNGAPTLLEPYLDTATGTEVLMTSVVVPLKIDGVVKGMVGLDLDLNSLSTLTASASLGESGYLT